MSISSSIICQLTEYFDIIDDNYRFKGGKSMRNLILYFLILSAMSLIVAALQWSVWLLTPIPAAFIVFEVGYAIYIRYFAKDLIRIERYLKASPNNPEHYYALSLKYGTKDDQLEALNRLLGHAKEGQSAYYKAMRAIKMGNYLVARQEAQLIAKWETKQYVLALIAAYEGEQYEAAQYVLAKEWMQSSIEAVLALQADDTSYFAQAKSSSVKESTGIQRFINAWYFEK